MLLCMNDFPLLEMTMCCFTPLIDQEVWNFIFNCSLLKFTVSTFRPGRTSTRLKSKQSLNQVLHFYWISWFLLTAVYQPLHSSPLSGHVWVCNIWIFHSQLVDSFVKYHTHILASEIFSCEISVQFSWWFQQQISL